MEIKTTFDIGQGVYVIGKYLRNKSWFEDETYYEIKEVEVIGVHIEILLNKDLNIWYELNNMGVIFAYKEEEIYATKEEAEQKLREIENEH